MVKGELKVVQSMYHKNCTARDILNAWKDILASSITYNPRTKKSFKNATAVEKFKILKDHDKAISDLLIACDRIEENLETLDRFIEQAIKLDTIFFEEIVSEFVFHLAFKETSVEGLKLKFLELLQRHKE